MKLNIDQIKEISLGAVRIEESEKGIDFYRFTKEQENLYKNRNADFYMKTFSTSGIKLKFITNSEQLFISTSVCKGCSRSYFAFDFFVNGEKVDSLKNFDSIDLSKDYTKSQYQLGEFSKEIYLGLGEKEVCIYFPWSVKATLNELILDDGSYIKPVKPSYSILCFGDSITHGYDSLYPSNKYTTKLANHLDAQEYNKAIGAEIFFPDLANTKEDFIPNYIIVSYGTNDWNKCSWEEFIENSKDFLHNLCSNYPTSKIFVITPIWRKEYLEYRKFGSFENVEKFITEIAKTCKNISVIRGFDFIPQNEAYFADLRLHPNDNGFDLYYRSLVEYIK